MYLEKPLLKIKKKPMKNISTLAMERRLKLAQLESRFHKSCSAVRLMGNEIRHVRSCLVQEILQVEEKKTLNLHLEIEQLKVCIANFISFLYNLFTFLFFL